MDWDVYLPLRLTSISQKTCSRRTLRVTVFVYIDDWLKPYKSLLPRTDKIGFVGPVDP